MPKPKKAPAPEPVSLPARNGTCATCDGPIHYYPPPTGGAGDLFGAFRPAHDAWAHLDPADWIANPHAATPKEGS